MKRCRVTIGVKGGAFGEGRRECIDLNTVAEGNDVAIKVAWVLGFTVTGSADFKVSRRAPRKGIENATHYIEVSYLYAGLPVHH